MPDRAAILTIAAVLSPACIGMDSCFVGSTRVATPAGPRRIDDLAVGDIVWAWSTAQGKPVPREVSAIASSVVERLWRVEAGELVVAGVTAQHPFFDPEAGRWRPVSELDLGSALLGWLGRGEARRLAVTALAERAERAVVYNLTVAGEQDYFAEGLLVHNKLLPKQDPACVVCDSGAHDPELLPVVAARCETVQLTVGGATRPLVGARIEGPSTVTVEGHEVADEDVVITARVDAASDEGVNDVLLDWSDGTSHAFADHFLVDGDACE